MHSGYDAFLNLLDQDYHESLQRYSARSDEFQSLVARALPKDWCMRAEGIWCFCTSATNEVPRQGWKIHLSAKLSNALEVLAKSSAVLFARGDLNFKFAVDPLCLAVLTSKNCSRGGSGKFITIYPPTERQFLEVLDELDHATKGIKGPYILSDYRYKNSGVLFYRYGGMQPVRRADVTGEIIPVLIPPDGTTTPDQRLAYPTTPAWVPAVLAPSGGGEDLVDSCLLKEGRYEIDGVLAFSNAGGVYSGTDKTTGMRIVVKEARPHINEGLGQDGSIDLLKKEFRLLDAIQDAGIAPKPIDLFQQCEHLFLVEEYIEGETLANYATRHNVLLRTSPTVPDLHQWYQRFRTIALELAGIVEIMHDRGIVFGDLSATNLIINDDSLKLKIIDFESARQGELDHPTVACTDGFASRERLSGANATYADDYFAMGSILFSCLMPFNGLLHLKPDYRVELMDSMRRGCGLPETLASFILDLMSDDPRRRPTPAVLRLALQVEVDPAPTQRPAKTCSPGAQVVENIVRHLKASATYERQDRLFPADPAVFSTNPLSLAYGAAGVVHALHLLDDRAPVEAVNWILNHRLSCEAYPPGLYVGLSGIAWALLEVGAQQEAENAFAIAARHPLKAERPDLFHGLSGFALTSLYFFIQTQDDFYRKQAAQTGRMLIGMSKTDEKGRYWVNGTEIPLGMAHGASGIAMVFLYLYLATGEEDFFEAGCEAMNFDLSFKVRTQDGGVEWPRCVGSKSPIYSYWKRGSAGIGQAVLRFYRVTEKESYADLLEEIYLDTNREYAALPGLFNGLAGMGEFLLGLYEVTGKATHLAAARHVASGIMRFAVQRDGTGFCGDRQSRLSCDYGTGSAGIALFLSRLNSGQAGSFYLDSLFASTPFRALQESVIA
jgi:serine/threonine protein kinase